MSKQTTNREKVAQTSLIIEMLRSVGYSNTSNALAELIDNSIESDASNINVSVIQDIVNLNGVRHTNIAEISVLDDGYGMSRETLGRCLSFGWGTRLETYTGLGRYGFGLKGASISQASRVEVYSWKDPNEIYMCYLDADEIKATNDDYLPEPVQVANLPERHMKEIISPSGTLVLWKNLNNIYPKRTKYLMKHLDTNISKIYRHFLNPNDDFQKTVSIKVEIKKPDGTCESHELTPNDPLYLMELNNNPRSRCGQVITSDEIRTGKVHVTTPAGEKSTVEIILTAAKPDTQKLNAYNKSKDYMKHRAANIGISFVRNGREIEHATKGFYNDDTRNRWFNIEVRFGSELDEYFGVVNSKQQVTKIRKKSLEERANLTKTVNELGDVEEAWEADFQSQLINKIEEFYLLGHNLVKGRRIPQDNPINPTPNPTPPRIDDIDPRDLDPKRPSLQAAEKKTYEEKLNELIDSLMAEDPQLTREQAEQIAKDQLQDVVNIYKQGWPGSAFLDIVNGGSGVIAKINSRHKFFADFYSVLESLDDKQGIDALETFIYAFALAEDNIAYKYNRELDDIKPFEDLREKLGIYLDKLLKSG